MATPLLAILVLLSVLRVGAIGDAERLANVQQLIKERVQESLLTLSGVELHVTAHAEDICSGAQFPQPVHPETFVYCTNARNATAPTVRIGSPSVRGLLFGAGHLLRSSTVSTATVLAQPSYWLRCQMISYRALSNSFDSWTVAMMRSYIGDLALFGANCIEMVLFAGFCGVRAS